MAEGDLPAVADQQVEPQRRHGVDQHQRQLPDDHPVAVERDAGRDQHHRGERRRAQRPVAPAAGLDPEGAHPWVTSGEPNSPDGRTSSTTKMTASGTSTLRSAPTAGT